MEPLLNRAARHGGVADRDGQSVVRSAAADRALHRTSRPRDAMGVREARRHSPSARPVTCRSCRVARRLLLDRENDIRSWCRIAHQELLDAPLRSPPVHEAGADPDRASYASRVRRSRWRRASRVVPPRRRRCSPGLLLAGDWIDTGLPATIESAVVSGHRAADGGAPRMNSIVIHYKELALKGPEPALVHSGASDPQSAGRALADLKVARVRAGHAGRIEIDLGAGGVLVSRDARPGRRCCSASPNFSLDAGRAPLEDFEATCRGDRARRPWRSCQAESFRVSVRRADKRFPLTSPQIEREVGGLIKEATQWPVNLSAPALTIHVEMLPGHAFYYFGKEPGAGGLPTGLYRRQGRVSAVEQDRLHPSPLQCASCAAAARCS